MDQQDLQGCKKNLQTAVTAKTYQVSL